jgi:hypothetical protein
MPIPNLKYQVGGGGWAVGNPSRLIPPGTIVDTSQPGWAALRGMAPVDAVALNQITFDWMTSSNGQLYGLGYAPGRVACGPGVVSTAAGMPSWYWEERTIDGTAVVKRPALGLAGL